MRVLCPRKAAAIFKHKKKKPSPGRGRTGNLQIIRRTCCLSATVIPASWPVLQLKCIMHDACKTHVMYDV